VEKVELREKVGGMVHLALQVKMAVVVRAEKMAVVEQVVLRGQVDKVLLGRVLGIVEQDTKQMML
jgi:hypothetical protein